MRLSMIVPAALLALVGCGDSTPDPNDPSQAQNQYAGQPGQYNPNQYQQPGTYQPGTTGTAPATTATAPAPTATAPAPTGGAATGSPATPLAAGAAAIAQPALQVLAQSEVPGMAADGSSFAGQFQEGQILEQPINIAAGKCYSVIAAGAGPQQLDIQIVLQPMPQIPPVVLAQATGNGPTTVLGGKGSCFKNATPLGGPGKVIVKATKGAGIAIAQVYSK